MVYKGIDQNIIIYSIIILFQFHIKKSWKNMNAICYWIKNNDYKLTKKPLQRL